MGGRTVESGGFDRGNENMKATAMQSIYELGRLVFTTREIADLAGSSVGSTTQNLNRLAARDIIAKITKGVWGLTRDKRFSPMLIIPYLVPSGRAYLSFVSALHYHGIIGQIPQVITVASNMHSKVVKTSAGTFEFHQLSPDFFDGFEWHGEKDYLIATPEKAFVDCLYLANRKGKRFAHFPELDLDLLDINKLERWTKKIRNEKLRKAVEKSIMTFSKKRRP